MRKPMVVAAAADQLNDGCPVVASMLQLKPACASSAVSWRRTSPEGALTTRRGSGGDGRVPPSIRLSYLICTTPRSGSNFLCEVLRATGVAGDPDDYFWSRPFWYAEWGVWAP